MTDRIISTWTIGEHRYVVFCNAGRIHKAGRALGRCGGRREAESGVVAHSEVDGGAAEGETGEREMTDTFHITPVTKSRTQRRCDWCGQQVLIGHPCTRYRFRDGRAIVPMVMHTECYDAMQSVASQEGGWIEWSPGEFSRGCGCVAGACRCGSDHERKEYQ